jgi:hypothetical protein
MSQRKVLPEKPTVAQLILQFPVILPPGANPIAVDKYINININTPTNITATDLTY